MRPVWCTRVSVVSYTHFACVTSPSFLLFFHNKLVVSLRLVYDSQVSHCAYYCFDHQQIKQMALKDQRIKLMNEILNGIKVK